VGLLFALGTLVALFVGLPDFRWFLAAILPFGLIVALALRFTARESGLPRPEDSAGPCWGPNMSKISFGGPAGLIFTLGSVAVFFIGLPEIRWFLAVSLPVGLIVGLILRLTARD
jgi:hypothetical protein